MASVRFTPNLKRFFPDLKPVEISATTIADLLHQVEYLYPGLRAYLVDEHGALREHVNVFLKGELIQDRQQLADQVEPGDEVFILQALSGG